MTGPADAIGIIPQPFGVAAHSALPGVFLLRGELDLAGAPTLTWALSHVEGVMGERVVLDVSDLSFIDASGVRAVSNALARLQRRGAEVIVRHPQPPVRRAFGLCGFDARLEPSDEATLDYAAGLDHALASPRSPMGTVGVEPTGGVPLSGVCDRAGSDRDGLLAQFLGSVGQPWASQWASERPRAMRPTPRGHDA